MFTWNNEISFQLIVRSIVLFDTEKIDRRIGKDLKQQIFILLHFSVVTTKGIKFKNCFLSFLFFEYYQNDMLIDKKKKIKCKKGYKLL